MRRGLPRVAAVVAYYPPTDLRGRSGAGTSIPAMQFDAGLESDLSPIVHVTPDDAPTLFLHGDRDITVPLSESQHMYDAFKEAGVATELIVVKGAGHSFAGADAQNAAKALADWFERFIVPSAP